MYLKPDLAPFPLLQMMGRNEYYVVRVGNLDLMHRVAKACIAYGGGEKTQRIIAHYGKDLKIEIMAYGHDNGIFELVSNGMIEDEEFVPKFFSNKFQMSELPLN